MAQLSIRSIYRPITTYTFASKTQKRERGSELAASTVSRENMPFVVRISLVQTLVYKKFSLNPNAFPTNSLQKKRESITMPAIASQDSILAIKSKKSCEFARSNGDSTPQKRRLRSDAAAQQSKSPTSTPMKWKSPRRSLNSSPNTPTNVSFSI